MRVEGRPAGQVHQLARTTGRYGPATHLMLISELRNLDLVLSVSVAISADTIAEAPRPVDACLSAACGPRSQCFSLRRERAIMLGHEGDALVGSSLGRGAGYRTWSQDRRNCLPSARRICSAVMRCRLKWRLLDGYQASGQRLGYLSPSRALPCLSRSHIRPVVKRMGCRYGH